MVARRQYLTETEYCILSSLHRLLPTPGRVVARAADVTPYEFDRSIRHLTAAGVAHKSWFGYVRTISGAQMKQRTLLDPHQYPFRVYATYKGQAKSLPIVAPGSDSRTQLTESEKDEVVGKIARRGRNNVFPESVKPLQGWRIVKINEDGISTTVVDEKSRSLTSNESIE